MSSLTLPRRILGALALFAILGVACGQKAGIRESMPGTFAGDFGEDGFYLGEPGDENFGTDGAGGPGGGGTRGGSTTQTRTTGSGGGGSGAISGGPADRTGVTDTQVKIGFHAPLTGAAAVPLVDIQYGVDLYRKWLNSKGVKIHGREVVAVWKDDTYNPATAVSVCREMVEKDKVFFLVGGAGTDQIQACARYAASRGIPYISAGVTEHVLNGLQNYFAITMTYPDQAKPLAQLIRSFGTTFTPQSPGGTPYSGGPILQDRCNESPATGTTCEAPGDNTPRVAMVYSNTEGFWDARDAFTREMGGGVFRVYPITKFNMSSGEANGLVQELKRDGVDIVYILTAPTNWLTILNESNGQAYFPRWVGVGLTKGVNTVVQVACARHPRAIEGSIFLNPWYSVHHPASAQFREAWNQFGNGDREPLLHDIAFGLWGGSIVQHVLFEAAGRDLSRQSFVATLDRLRNATAANVIKTVPGGITDVYSRLNYSSDNHFGADQAHVIWARCEGRTGYWNYFENGQFRAGF